MDCYREELFEGLFIRADLIPMGKDITLAVYGGDVPHVGSVVIAQPRQSLTGNGISATSSVYNLLGHKDEEVARAFAETLAKRWNCTVVCSCGIHVDGMKAEGIEKVRACCERLLGKMADSRTQGCEIRQQEK